LRNNTWISIIKLERIKEEWIPPTMRLIQKETIILLAIQLKIVIQPKKFAGFAMEGKQKIFPKKSQLLNIKLAFQGGHKIIR
jgi:hypothetical protein